MSIGEARPSLGASPGSRLSYFYFKLCCFFLEMLNYFQGAADFRYGLFKCCETKKLCLFTACCPCYTNGKTAESLGLDFYVCCIGYFFCDCLVSALVRRKVRQSKRIDGRLRDDCLIHCLCPCCALVQDNREIGGNAMQKPVLTQPKFFS